MRFSTNLVPLRLELSESASSGDSYHVRRIRLNLTTLIHSPAARSNGICVLQAACGEAQMLSQLALAAVFSIYRNVPGLEISSDIP
jgi:hypothetical protein